MSFHHHRGVSSDPEDEDFGELMVSPATTAVGGASLCHSLPDGGLLQGQPSSLLAPSSATLGHGMPQFPDDVATGNSVSHSPWLRPTTASVLDLPVPSANQHNSPRRSPLPPPPRGVQQGARLLPAPTIPTSPKSVAPTAEAPSVVQQPKKASPPTMEPAVVPPKKLASPPALGEASAAHAPAERSAAAVAAVAASDAASSESTPSPLSGMGVPVNSDVTTVSHSPLTANSGKEVLRIDAPLDPWGQPEAPNGSNPPHRPTTYTTTTTAARKRWTTAASRLCGVSIGSNQVNNNAISVVAAAAADRGRTPLRSNHLPGAASTPLNTGSSGEGDSTPTTLSLIPSSSRFAAGSVTIPLTTAIRHTRTASASSLARSDNGSRVNLYAPQQLVHHVISPNGSDENLAALGDTESAESRHGSPHMHINNHHHHVLHPSTHLHHSMRAREQQHPQMGSPTSSVIVIDEPTTEASPFRTKLRRSPSTIFHVGSDDARPLQQAASGGHPPPSSAPSSPAALQLSNSASHNRLHIDTGSSREDLGAVASQNSGTPVQQQTAKNNASSFWDILRSMRHDDTNSAAQQPSTAASPASANTAGAPRKPRRRPVSRMEEMRRQTGSPVHFIPWDQRSTSGVNSNPLCAFCVAPRFWNRMDWAVRLTFLGMIPCIIINLNPEASAWFLDPTNLPQMVVWVSYTNFGLGLSETVRAFKGLAISFFLALITINVNLTNTYAYLAWVFFSSYLIVAMGDAIWKNILFFYLIQLTAYKASPNTVDLLWLGYFLRDFSIGTLMGAFSFSFPRPKWAINNARKQSANLANLLSTALQGVVASFWCNPIERSLNLVRLRLLRGSIEEAQSAISDAFAQSAYEPVSKTHVANLERRFDLLKNLVVVVHTCMSLVELIDNTKDLAENEAVVVFGELIAEPLAGVLSAFDAAMLKLFDKDEPCAPEDLQSFSDAVNDFLEELTTIRERFFALWDETSYLPGVYVGALLFGLERAFTLIINYRPVDPEQVPSAVKEWTVDWVVADAKFVVTRVRDILTRSPAGIEALKQGLRLALATTVSESLQFIFGQTLSSTVIIAFVSQNTNAGSFMYGANRMQGIVFAGVLAYLAHTFASNNLYALGSLLSFLVLLGAYMQTSPETYVAGNSALFTMCNMFAAGTSQYVATRIQTNFVAILVYFGVASTFWPRRSTDEIRIQLLTSLGAFRTAMVSLLDLQRHPPTALDAIPESNSSMVGMEQPLDRASIAQQSLISMRRAISLQRTYLPQAVSEPTMLGVPFPDEQFRKIVRLQESVYNLCMNMVQSFQVFESSKESDSGHWDLVDAVAAPCGDLSDLIFGVIDLYVLTITKTTVVPTAQLVRFQRNVQEVVKSVTQFMTTAFLEYRDKAMMQRNDVVLGNMDVHSFEAFSVSLMMIAGETMQLMMSVLEMQHFEELKLLF